MSKSIALTVNPNHKLPNLYARCQRMMFDISVLIGIPEEQVAAISGEANLAYAHWCADYNGTDLLDSFMGFQQMLQDLPLPWPYVEPWPSVVCLKPKIILDWENTLEEMALNGTSKATVFLTMAYDHSSHALSLLDEAQKHSGDELEKYFDSAAWNAIVAIRFFDYAKQLLGTKDNVVFQQSKEMAQNGTGDGFD